MRKPSYLALLLVTMLLGLASFAASSEAAETVRHRVAIHVDQNDPAVMNLALNNAVNVVQHYSPAGEEVEVEIVAYGPGLHMLRDDTSPVKARRVRRVYCPPRLPNRCVKRSKT